MVRKREKHDAFKVLASGTKDIKQDSKGYRKSRFGVQKFSFWRIESETSKWKCQVDSCIFEVGVEERSLGWRYKLGNLGIKILGFKTR